MHSVRDFNAKICQLDEKKMKISEGTLSLNVNIKKVYWNVVSNE